MAKCGHAAKADALVGEMSIVVAANPNASALRLTAELLSQQRIASAALVATPLPEDKFWIAAEWWRRLVVETTEVDKLASVSDAFLPRGTHEALDLVIFGVRKEAPPPNEESARPRESLEKSDDVRQRPGDYYREFADPLIGGASALYAAGYEAAKSRGFPDGTVFVAPPERFGFSVDAGEESVVAWRRKSVITIQVVGFGLGSDREVATLFAEHRLPFDPDDLARKAAAWREKDYRFGVGLVLRGLEDPPVVIPVGSVYQQPSIGSPMQNLAVAQSANPMVFAGATVPLILPAWCLNPSFSPPSGALAPTPLIAATASGSQTAVWEDIRRRNRGLL